MKFALIALTAVVAANQIPVITDIKFNKSGLDGAATYARQEAKKLHHEQKVNQILNRNAVVDAYSQYVVEEHVGVSKNFTPLAKFQVEMVDAMTPAGACNQAAATECVNTWQLGGFRQDQKKAMEACAIKAGCQSNFGNMSAAQKKALANQYKTSVQTLDAAYENMNNKFMGNLKQAHEANKKRQQVLKKHFFEALKEETELMGCNRECLPQAHKAGLSPAEAIAKCCNDGVVRVSWTNVNTAAVVENNYGDIENLSMDEFREIDASLEQMYSKYQA